MSSCRDSRDNIAGTAAPTAELVVVGIFPTRESRPLLLLDRNPTNAKLSRVFTGKRRKASKPKSEPWPPKELALPDSIEETERGKIKQRELVPEPRDDSRSTKPGWSRGTVAALSPADFRPIAQEAPECDGSGKVSEH
jgi:hypothetical protein